MGTTRLEEENERLKEVNRQLTADYTRSLERLKSDCIQIDELNAEVKELKAELNARLTCNFVKTAQKQEQEIEKLKAENEELTKVVSSKVYDLIDNAKEIADAREAWEKQAQIDVLNEVKKLSHCDNFFTDGKWHRYVFVDDIDKLLEEYKND